MITPDAAGDPGALLGQLEARVRSGINLVQLRSKDLDPAAFRTVAQEAVSICRVCNGSLLLNSDPELVRELGADGVHLDGRRLAQCRERPLDEGYWVAASCHDGAGLAKAAEIGADFAVLSPVKETPTHPQARILQWPGFASLVRETPIPIYALGGMVEQDLGEAWRHGAQGIAAIRALWEPEAG